MSVLVFGMENCPGCLTVKRLLTENNVLFEERDVMNVEHMAEAQEYGVRGVPTVVRTFELGFGAVTGSRAEDIAKIREMVGF